MSNEIVLYNSPEAARFVTNISGWDDRHGRFFGNGANAEHMARWSGCTHRRCECGNIMEKHWTKCEICRERRELEKYKAMPEKEWDEESALYSMAFDEYFDSWGEVLDFMTDENCNSLEQMLLVICVPVYLTQIDTDFWENDLPEDVELPEKVIEAMDELNRTIEQVGQVAWIPGQYACFIPVSKKEA